MAAHLGPFYHYLCVWWQLTVLFPRFLTRQFKYAVLPSSAVTFFDAGLSKYGPTLNASRSSAFGLEPYALAPFALLPPPPAPLLSFALDESRCDANTGKWQMRKRDRCVIKMVVLCKLVSSFGGAEEVGRVICLVLRDDNQWQPKLKQKHWLAERQKHTRSPRRQRWHRLLKRFNIKRNENKQKKLNIRGELMKNEAERSAGKIDEEGGRGNRLVEHEHARNATESLHSHWRRCY